MALVKCPDCGSEVSELAPTCPKCGRPIGSIPIKKQVEISTASEKATSKPALKKVINIAAGIFLLLVVYGVLQGLGVFNKSGSEAPAGNTNISPASSPKPTVSDDIPSNHKPAKSDDSSVIVKSNSTPPNQTPKKDLSANELKAEFDSVLNLADDSFKSDPKKAFVVKLLYSYAFDNAGVIKNEADSILKDAIRDSANDSKLKSFVDRFLIYKDMCANSSDLKAYLNKVMQIEKPIFFDEDAALNPIYAAFISLRNIYQDYVKLPEHKIAELKDDFEKNSAQVSSGISGKIAEYYYGFNNTPRCDFKYSATNKAYYIDFGQYLRSDKSEWLTLNNTLWVDACTTIRPHNILFKATQNEMLGKLKQTMNEMPMSTYCIIRVKGIVKELHKDTSSIIDAEVIGEPRVIRIPPK
jgi:hypothetical protein